MDAPPGAGPPPPATAPDGSPYIAFTDPIIQEQLRPLTIAYFVSFTCFGISLLQFYYITRQLLALKAATGKLAGIDVFFAIMIVVLFVSDFVDQITKANCYDETVNGYLLWGVPRLLVLPPMAAAVCITDGWVVCCTHLIYLVRIVKMNAGRNRLMVFALVFVATSCSIIQFVGAIITGVVTQGPADTWEHGTRYSAKLWLGGAALTDVVLCLAFVFSIRQHRTEFESTNDVITRWVGFTLETGILTSLLQIVDLILYLAYDQKPFYQAITVIIPKVYIISTLLLFQRIYKNRLASAAVNSSAGMGSTGAYTGGSTSYPVSGYPSRFDPTQTDYAAGARYPSASYPSYGVGVKPSMYEEGMKIKSELHPQRSLDPMELQEMQWKEMQYKEMQAKQMGR